MNGINLSDYQFGVNETGFGQASADDLAGLQKALEVGHLRGGDGAAVSGGSLKLESLERTLYNLEFKEQDIKLWKHVPKAPAYSTVEEYERLRSYGADVGGFIGEGELPEVTDGQWERVAELVKYIGTTRETTIQAQLVRNVVGDLIRHQVELGTKWVLRVADRAMFRGNAKVDPYSFNGFLALHQNFYPTLDAWYNAPTVIDLRGAHLSEDKFEEATQLLIDNHASPDFMIGSTPILSNFAKQFHEMKYFPTPQMVANGEVGFRAQKFHSQFGSIDLDYDKFMNDQIAKYSTTNATHAKAPAKPTKDGAAPTNSVVDAISKFGTAEAGDYYFAVSAVNRFGESQLEFLSTSLVTVASGRAIDLKFAATAGSYAPTGYRIYRSEKDPVTAYSATPMYPVFDVSVAELAAGFDGGAATAVRDRCRFIANTQKSMFLEKSGEVWGFKQLAPLMKMDLARTSTADRFMVLLFGTPQLYAPTKMVIFINAGKYVPS